MSLKYGTRVMFRKSLSENKQYFIMRCLTILGYKKRFYMINEIIDTIEQDLTYFVVSDGI